MDPSIFIIILVSILSYILIGMYLREDKLIVDVKKNISKVLPSVQDLHIYEGDSPRVVGKKTIYLKLYDSEGDPYDLNTLTYVCLHEIAHILCDVTDTTGVHSPEFYRIFDKLVSMCTKEGVFNPSVPIHKDFL